MLRMNTRQSYSMLFSLYQRRQARLAIERSKLLIVHNSTISKSNNVVVESIPILGNKIKSNTQVCDESSSSRLVTSDGLLSKLALDEVRESQRRMRRVLNDFEKQERLALKSYLRVCVDVGLYQQAFQALKKLRFHKDGQIVTAQHCNIVISGFAKSYSIPEIMETRAFMKKHRIQPNMETYAYILLAHTKYREENKKNKTLEILEAMRKRDLNIAHVFRSCYLSAPERESIRDLIKEVKPDYEDEFCNDSIEYKCTLLKDIHQVPSKPYNIFGTDVEYNLSEWAEQQREIEGKCGIYLKSIANYQKTGLPRYINIWDNLKKLWRENLTKVLDESLKELKEQAEKPAKIHIYPFLCSIEKESLIEMLLDEVETNATCTSYNVSTHLLHVLLGGKIMTRYLKNMSVADGSHDELQALYKDYVNNYIPNQDLVSKMTPREFIQIRALETKNYSIYRDRLRTIDEWHPSITSSIGRFCYGILMRSIKFDPTIMRNRNNDINKKNLVYAFYTAYYQVDCGPKIKEELRAHQDFERLYVRSHAMTLKFNYGFLPSLSPPYPWLSRSVGGYLTNKSRLVRLATPLMDESEEEDSILQNQKLYPSLDSLNAIGLCPWIVNKDILDIIIGIFRSGGDTKLNVPMERTKMESMMPALPPEPSKADTIKYNKEKRKHQQRMKEMYSLWCDCLFRLSIANHYRDKIFWFPHNMDFRGRTYPIPPHFNHLGNDLARSLLLFAKGRPLGEDGLDWLKLHLINLVGNMKSNSTQERIEYANSILHLEILDSADNPLDGRGWWKRNENPWQVLACCKEIARAIRSLDHKQYISHFPIHQDGSCNGLQHYAALGRDPMGAAAVNLVPNDRPQDVYARVVDIVESLRKKDAEKGVQNAVMLDGFIKRKVIKQTVMTNVYGVTRYGARQQIARQLANKNYNEKHIWAASLYLTAKTFEAIGQMFNKSRAIQDWFNECAHIIATRCRKPVSWETPLGFPITQPYTSVKDRNNRSHILAKQFEGFERSQLNSSKQKTAFPPNYIHSLDSSHMMLTSLFCHRAGITYVSVHDCYWTHPSTVSTMNRICREQFIALHSQPLLEDLSKQFIMQFANQLGKESDNGSDAVNTYAEISKKSRRAKPSAIEDVDIVDGDASLASLMDDTNGDDLLDVESLISDSTMADIKKNYSESNRALDDLYRSAREGSEVAIRDLFKKVPEKGELDLGLVKDSVYFFS